MNFFINLLFPLLLLLFLNVSIYRNMPKMSTTGGAKNRRKSTLSGHFR